MSGVFIQIAIPSFLAFCLFTDSVTEQLVGYLDQQVRQYWNNHPSLHSNTTIDDYDNDGDGDGGDEKRKKEKELVDDCLLVIQLMNNKDGLELLLRKCFYQHMIECN